MRVKELWLTCQTMKKLILLQHLHEQKRNYYLWMRWNLKHALRERCHHTMEIQTYSNAYRGKKLNSNQTETTLLYMDVWRERASQNSPEYIMRENLKALQTN